MITSLQNKINIDFEVVSLNCIVSFNSNYQFLLFVSYCNVQFKNSKTYYQVQINFFNTFNPVRTAKKISNVRQNFTSSVPIYMEFKSVGIFAKSFFVLKIGHFMKFQFFYSAQTYYKKKFRFFNSARSGRFFAKKSTRILYIYSCRKAFNDDKLVLFFSPES